MRNFKLTILFVLIFLINTSCSIRKDNEKVNFAAFQLYTSGLVVAASQNNANSTEKTCFEENNFNCNIIKRAKGPDVVDALIGGSSDFGTLANTPVVLQAMQSDTLVIFATIMTTNHDIKVVGHKSAGINSGFDLKGKKIGFVGGTIGEIFLDRYLKKYGIDKSDVTLVSAGPASLRDYFLANELDAIIIWEPTIQDILNDKAISRNEVFVDVDTTLYEMKMHLVATPEKLKKYKDEAKLLVKSLICGEDRLYENPASTRKLLEKWLDRKENTLIDVFDKKSFNIELNVPLLLKELKEEAIWAKKSVFKGKGTIPNNFSVYVDPSILESVAPERVIK